MKKFLLSICSLVFSMAVFSQANCPSQFTRNNGNARGCASQIKLYFNTCPSTVPTLDSIKINGIVQPEKFTLIEQKCTGNSIYADYCVSDDNLPPAGRITVFLTYRDGTSGAIIGTSACDIASAGPTPVILSGFAVQRTSNAEVSASWQTQQEISSSRFEIERAFDNNSFEKIGTALAAGSSGTLKSYTFSDKTNSSSSTSFYRIKMIDKDAAFTYSETRSVKGSGLTADFVVFPNPCRGTAKITVMELKEPVEIQVLDVSGRLVQSVVLTNSSSAELSNLQKGTYFVRSAGKLSGATSVRKLSVIE